MAESDLHTLAKRDGGKRQDVGKAKGWRRWSVSGRAVHVKKRDLRGIFTAGFARFP